MSNDINQEVAKELVAQTTGEAYKDVIHPTAHTVGQILSFIPRTIKVWLGKWEKWILNGEYAIAETEKLLAEKLKGVPEEKIVEPELYVAVPALQQLSYSIDNPDLREMYANLLAASMNSDTKWSVHPSFVEIIRQLTPDEAKLLKKVTGVNAYPLIDIQLVLPKDEGYQVRLNNFSNVADGVCDNPENISSYIGNLCRLGLLEIPYGTHINHPKIYEPLENHPTVKAIMQQTVPQGCRYEISKKLFCLTPFGKTFVEVCVTA